MRNISFSLTTDQFIHRRKIVTRRLGWVNLRPGDILQGVKKSQGLKRGEKIEPLGLIKVIRVDREPLRKVIDFPGYGRREMVFEGFPGMSPESFVEMFIRSHKGATPDSQVTRIQYEYL